jgi:pimeloyl-ACP methyl ester carboxylesterase
MRKYVDHRLQAELAPIPRYYIADQSKGMAETISELVPPLVDVRAVPWLTEAELDVYVSEWGCTGFQGALNCHRVYVDPSLNAQVQLFADRTVDAPSGYIAGKSDWTVYFPRGAVDVIKFRACPRMQEHALLDGADHWPQHEQPEAVCGVLVRFLRSNTDPSQRPQ